MLTVVRISDVKSLSGCVSVSTFFWIYTMTVWNQYANWKLSFLGREMIQKFDLLLHFCGCQLFFGSSVTFMVIQGISDSSCNKTRVIIRILLVTWVLFYLWVRMHYLYNDTCLFKLTSIDHWIIRKQGKPQHIDEKFPLFFYVNCFHPYFGKTMNVYCDWCSTLLHSEWRCVLERLPELFTSNKSCGYCRIVILCLSHMIPTLLK